MPIELWTTFIVASLPVHFAPGPNNVLAFTLATARGYRVAHMASFGRYPAYLMIFLAAGLGLGILLAQSPVAFSAVRIIGAVYLAWIGLRMVRQAGSINDIAEAGGNDLSVWPAARREFAVAILNPKAVVFATAFYAQFVDPSLPGYATQFASMVAVSLSLECTAAGFYALLGGMLRGRAGGRSGLVVLTRILGVIMIGFAGLLAAG
ncbi:LysE family translocator [Nitratireductor luteus]|uniref:LysE family translocator n=1 Tax=Nitratireductor luteus TaxID=2976980 RepID=UPI00223EF674|nr:LysE family translocator [Nitratireductor luteus]